MADELQTFNVTVVFTDGDALTVCNVCSYHLEDSGFFSFINQSGGVGFHCAAEQVKYIRVNETRD